MLVDVLGFTIILPLLPFYAEKLGATPLTVGLLIATYGFCQLIAGPILGQISDRVGRKQVLLVSQLGTFFGFLILTFSRTLLLVFVARIIDGLTAGNFSVAQAYISDVTEPKNRAKAFGLVGIAFGLGFLFGPAVSGFLARFDYHYPIFAAAGLSLTSIAATYFLLPSSPPAPASESTQGFGWSTYWQSFQDKNLAPLLWQFFAFVFSFSVFISGFALFAERRFTVGGLPFDAKEVGYVFAYVGFLGVIIQAGFIGQLVRVFGESRLVKFGFLGMSLGYFLLGWIHTVPYLLAAVTISFIGSSVLRPSLVSQITQKTGRDRQGTAMGLTQSLLSISQIVAPIISGTLIEHLWLSSWAWVGAFISVLGFLLVSV